MDRVDNTLNTIRAEMMDWFMDTRKDWKEIMKERRQAIYRRMKENRRAYMNQPEVKERMQIAKAKAKNKRKAYMAMIKEEKRSSKNRI